MTSCTVDVPGPVHVADLGGRHDGPVALCVHGLAGSSAAWRPLADALAPTHRVLAVDLPGHGRSPAAGRTVSVPDAVDVLQSVTQSVVDRVGDPVTLVGHSMGAAVSVLAAARSPRLVERLVLLAPPLPRRGLSVASTAVLPQVALCLWPRMGVLAMRRGRVGLSAEEVVVRRLRATCASYDALPDVVAALAAELRAARERGEDPTASFVQAARSVGLLVARGRGYRDAIAAVRAPVQVLHGALDRVVRPSGLGQLEHLGPQWETRLLPDVGHSPHLEAPAEVARLLVRAREQPVSGPSGAAGRPARRRPRPPRRS